jgi:hypothetical protein
VRQRPGHTAITPSSLKARLDTVKVGRRVLLETLAEIFDGGLYPRRRARHAFGSNHQLNGMAHCLKLGGPLLIAEAATLAPTAPPIAERS